MRFLGNKTAILKDIESLLRKKNLIGGQYVFFDAFCGTGSVADHFKRYFAVAANDNLTWAVAYTRGRLCAEDCAFDRLGFDPVEFLNNSGERRRGFFYEHYSPGGSERKYFTPENAERIDYFRRQIEAWKEEGLLSRDEYAYLLACLIESVSDVSNTAGVYGAFLKKWDPRALKPIVFSRVDAAAVRPRGDVVTYNAKIEDIIGDVPCDILYLDPPYTQNQYGTQYHLLETLVLNDEPELSPVTGSRKTAPMRSDWSKDIRSHILLDKVVAKTKAKYIVLSYNNDGFMSKEYIEATLKRYGKADTYVCKKIPYKKYKNWKSQNESKHFEYLFFVEKKEEKDVIYESPLNYTGSKAKVIPQIRANVKPGRKDFYDLFGGGFNVGINVSAERVFYTDNNGFVTDLIRSFSKYDTFSYISYVRKIIKTFGLKKGDADSYNRAREYYNARRPEERDPRMLFAVLLYGFQQQIRFNGNHEFNNPVGARWFNDKVLEKLISFSRRLKERQCTFETASYLEMENRLTKDAFVYLDPPYLLTTGAYNDGKRGFDGWSARSEDELFSFADRLDRRGIPFMLSYVAEHKGKKNERLPAWVKDRGYTMLELGDILGISGSRRKEILVINYDV